MLTYSIEKLCKMGSRAIVEPLDQSRALKALSGLGKLGEELIYLLQLKNGFYAFESALHMFPFASDGLGNSQDLLRWNLTETWKRAYDPEISRLFCFAEDAFGYQFCFRDDRVSRFDPETGESADLCGTLEDWAALILSELNVQTGYPVASKWQAANGPIKPGNRLVPIYPFISAEGSYELGNLYEIDSSKGLLSRADLARQLKGVSDGTKVRLVPENTIPAATEPSKLPN